MDVNNMPEVGEFDFSLDYGDEFVFEDGSNDGEFNVSAVEDNSGSEIANNNEITEETVDSDEERARNFEFINNQRAKSTIEKTSRDIRRFKEYLTERKVDKPMEEIEARQLDKLLTSYIRGFKRVDGGDYEPDSVSSMVSSIDRYLREQGYDMNITEDASFKSSREMLEAKRKLLKAEGKGNKPNKSEPLSTEEIEILWTNGGFGRESPEELLAAIWYLITLHFGLRGNNEVRQLKQGDIHVSTDDKGNLYLEFTERMTKTRRGGTGTGSARAFTPKAWETKDDRCPIKYYHEYNSRKPKEMLDPEKPFLLAVNHKRVAQKSFWFSRSPMGHNEIGRILQKAGKRAGIARKLTNHAVRKTSITTLVHADLSFNMIAQHSGHKNPESIKHYAVASIEQQRNMSKIISKNLKAKKPSTVTSSSIKDDDDRVAEGGKCQKNVDKDEFIEDMRAKGRARVQRFLQQRALASQAASQTEKDDYKVPTKKKRKSVIYDPFESDSEDDFEPQWTRKDSDDIPTQVYENGVPSHDRPKEKTNVLDDHQYCQKLESTPECGIETDSEVEIPFSQVLPKQFMDPAKNVPKIMPKKSDLNDMMKNMFKDANIQKNVFNFNFKL